MVQGCDISIMDVKSSVNNKNIKLAVPTEEQKRLAKLSHVERIDNQEEDIIRRMVEITNHTYEKCAMELAITNMDMTQAISNILEGNNADEWETKQKRSRPEKKNTTLETSDLKSKRSTSKPERARPSKCSEERDLTDRSKSVRGGSTPARGGSTPARGGSTPARGGSTPARGGSTPARGGSTRPVSRGGHVAGRGRGGKRQLPPRMDRQRNCQDDSRPRLQDSGRGGNRGGSYRHNNRGAKRHDWRSLNGEESEERTNYSAEWPSDGEWVSEQAEVTSSWRSEVIRSSEETSGWGVTTAAGTAADDGWGTEKTDSTVEAWESSSSQDWVGSEEAPTSHAITQHKRPAYTQAFSNPLSSMLGSSEFTTATTRHAAPLCTSASFSFPFSSQPQSSGGGRQEQAVLLSSNTGRKISVEQLFQLHEKSNGAPDPGVATVDEAPCSPPTSSTSSSSRKGRRPPRGIPSEPVEMPGSAVLEMPGSAVPSLDVQFGSIHFLDNSEDDLAPSLTQTPASKTDAATSTTPHDSEAVPGIREVPKEASMPVVDRQQLIQSQSPQTYTSPTTSTLSPLHKPPVLHQLAQSPLVSQPAPPPNLPPPNMDNIRNANSLMTNHALSEESSMGARVESSMAARVESSGPSSFGMKRSLPPGVYPATNLGGRGGHYYGAENSNSHSGATHHSNSQTQSSYNDMARYYNSSNSFDLHQQQQHSSQRPQQSEGGFGGQDKAAHYTPRGTDHYTPRGTDPLQHLVSTAAHQSHHVGAGITSTTAPTGLGTGYPAPLLGYPYHPHTIHYPNNLYTANYYPFNPLNFAAQTKQPHSVPSYAGSTTFGASETPSPQFGQYETEPHSYKELYTGSGSTKHTPIQHLPAATSSNDYSKMMAQGADKSVFNMGYTMQFPNYIQQYQQQGRGMDSRPGTGAAPKHAYWSHR